MRDIQMVLERWGGWASSDNSGVDYSPIAAGFKGLYRRQVKPDCHVQMMMRLSLKVARHD